MPNYTVFLKNMKDSLSDDLPLYQNIYSNLKPVNLKGNALICSSRCSMDIAGNRRENGVIINNTGILSISGSGTTTVSGTIQSDLVTGNEKFDFYKILFIPQLHQINDIVSNGELHIIFKDKDSEKYQVNCILFNQNNDNNNELIAQKLVDEYFINNIPNRSKGQITIKRSSLKWYIADLVPMNQSYYSYILPNNNNVLMVLYEDPIHLSKEFIAKLKENVYNNTIYTFNYTNLNQNSALFYTYDSMTSKDKRDKNLKKICDNSDVSEKFNSNDDNNDNSKTIIYNNTKTSNDLNNIINDIEKNNEVKEKLTDSETISDEDVVNYNSETKNINDNKKKSISKIVITAILVFIYILGLIIMYIIYESKKKYAKEYKITDNSPSLLDKSQFNKLFYNYITNLSKDLSNNSNNSNKNLIFVGAIILSTFVYGGMYFFTNYFNSVLSMIIIIVLMILSFFIIGYIIFKFNEFNLCYSVSKENLKELLKVNELKNKSNNSNVQKGGEDDIKFNDICLSSLGNCINNNNILESWINEIRNNKSKEYLVELKNKYQTSLTNIKKNTEQIDKWYKEILNFNTELIESGKNAVDFQKPDADILKFEKETFQNKKYNEIDTIQNYNKLGYKEWNDKIYKDGDYLDKQKDDIESKFKKEIDDFDNLTNQESELYKNLEKAYIVAKERWKKGSPSEIGIKFKKTNTQNTENTSNPSNPSQTGGDKKYHYYEPKKFRNDKIVKRILKNLK